LGIAQPELGNASSSYGQVLKSSVLIGSSQLASVALGILRTKILAVLIGPAGLGVIGLYMSITNTVGALSGMGISTSGVREIAEAGATNDQVRISRTIKTLRRTALVLGVLGSLLLLVLCRPLSLITFGSTQQAGAVALLSLTVLFGAVSGGQNALVQGLRRIRDLAALSLLGALLSTVCSLPLVYLFGEKGIVPFLLVLSIMTILPSWWYARRVRVDEVALSWRETWHEARGLLRLGFVFMVSGLLAAGTAYVSRVVIRDKLGVDATGIYFAAWTLAGFYVRFILQAMAADFYPRLTAAAKDHVKCSRLVNEQAEVALLLAVPGILATLAFAPQVIQLFYSAKFGPAVEVLRWQILGVLLQVASLPMGFVIMAQGRARLFMTFDVVVNAASLSFLWLGVHFWGLPGTGIAFLAQYGLIWLADYAIVRRLIDFRWSAANVRFALVLVPAVTAAFLSQWVLSALWSTIVSASITLFVAIYSLRTLLAVVGADRVSRLVLQVKTWLGWTP